MWVRAAGEGSGAGQWARLEFPNLQLNKSNMGKSLTNPDHEPEPNPNPTPTCTYCT